MQARERVLEWVDTRSVDERSRLMIDTLMPEDETVADSYDDGLQMLGLVLPVAAPETDAFLRGIRGHRQSTALPDADVLEAFNSDPFVANHVRLIYSRWLCQNEFYDEALAILEPVDESEVIDPASLLFYRGIASQRVLKTDDSIATLERLLENTGSIPLRYERLAQLVLDDLRPFEAESLDEVARLMDDIQRRQRLHHLGRQVREEEERVIAILDKLIKDIEDRMPPPSDGDGPGANNPGNPMDTSRAAGGTGPGNVDRKPQAPGRQWGNLDPQDRAAALAEMAKDLPAHYREVIEEYFRRIAQDDKD